MGAISDLFATPTPTADAVPISDGSARLNEWFQMNTARLLGRTTAGVGEPEEISIGSGLSFSGTTLNATGGGGTPGGSNTQIQYNNSSAFGGISGATSDGTNVTFGSDKLRATSPRIVSGINDMNGAQLVAITPAASSVNNFEVANASTGASPTISAIGSDTNVSLVLAQKGFGFVNLSNTNNGVYFSFDSTPAVRFKSSGTTLALTGVSGGPDNIITGSVAGDYCFRMDNSKSVLFSTDAGTSIAVKFVAATGQLIISSSLKTGNPASGTAAAWKLGSLQTNYAEADIAGTAVRLALSNRGLVPLFDHFADAGNSTATETDLYSDITAAGQFAANGDKLDLEYGGIFVSSATATRQIKFYFGGTAIFDTGALTLSLSSAWTLFITLIRVSATIVRYMASFTTEGAALSAYTSVGELTGLTLSGTNVAKITGQAAGVGAASNDIVAKMGAIEFIPSA